LDVIHTYPSRFIPEGVEEASETFLRDAHNLLKLFSYEATDKQLRVQILMVNFSLVNINIVCEYALILSFILTSPLYYLPMRNTADVTDGRRLIAVYLRCKCY
jgi:hypothetical protein